MPIYKIQCAHREAGGESTHFIQADSPQTALKQVMAAGLIVGRVELATAADFVQAGLATGAPTIEDDSLPLAESGALGTLPTPALPASGLIPRASNVGSSLRFGGVILSIVAAVFFVGHLALDTTVGSEVGRINNLGKLYDRQTGLIVSGVFLAAGILVHSLGVAAREIAGSQAR